MKDELLFIAWIIAITLGIPLLLFIAIVYVPLVLEYIHIWIIYIIENLPKPIQ